MSGGEAETSSLRLGPAARCLGARISEGDAARPITASHLRARAPERIPVKVARPLQLREAYSIISSDRRRMHEELSVARGFFHCGKTQLSRGQA